MITYCFLASNITRAIVGGTIGSVLLIVIVTLICCIILVGKKCHRKQNIRTCNTQEVELQAIRSPRTSQITQTSQSRPFPNTTLNTIPQTQNQHFHNVTQSTHYSGRDHRPSPSYNECCNRIIPHGAPTAVPSNQCRQPNPSVTLTSFAALTSNNALVQIFRQQSSNVENCESSSDVHYCVDNPTYEMSGAGVD